jgi:hypothetical protein
MTQWNKAQLAVMANAAPPEDGATFVLSPLTGEAGDSTDWELDVTQGSAGAHGQHQPGLYPSSRRRSFGI